MKLPRRVTICEVGTRDGFQIEPDFIPTDRKIDVVNRLAAAGMPRIEVTSFVSPKAIPQLRDAAEVMAAIVRRKLRASGVRSIPRGAQERTRQNPCGMTNRQLRVLGLLVEGRRNADIARRLFVAEKTVDHHVSAVLAKLGVRSRGEAVAAATRLGLCEGQIEELVAKK